MNKRKIITFIIWALIILSLILGYKKKKKNREYTVVTENNYNMAFYDIESYQMEHKPNIRYRQSTKGEFRLLCLSVT